MTYRTFLRSSRPSFLLMAVLGRLPYAIVPLGTILLVHAGTGSFTVAGVAAGAQSLAIAAGGLAVGIIARWVPPRRIGFWAAVINAISLVLLIVSSRYAPPVVVVAATVVVGLTQPQVGPLIRVHWAARFRSAEPRLGRTAMSYEGAVDEASFVLGPALVGALLLLPTAGFPQAGPLCGAAVLLLVAAAPVARRYADPLGDHGQDRTPRRRARASVHWPSLLTLTAAMTCAGVIFGAVQTGAAAYAAASGAPELAGLYFAELGIGSAVAGASCAWLPERFGPATRRWLFPVALTVGMILLPWGAANQQLPIVIAVAGLTVGPYMVTLYSLTEHQTALAAMAQAMAVLCAGGPVGTAVGQLLAGVLVDGDGPVAAFAIAPVAAAGGLAASLLNVRARRSEHAGRSRPDESLDLN